MSVHSVIVDAFKVAATGLPLACDGFRCVADGPRPARNLVLPDFATDGGRRFGGSGREGAAALHMMGQMALMLFRSED
jgi:hypothetical protein